ncbi:MAG: hypothetical protein EOM24_34520 [Chloroflexia bacterium]|nr:hypothetical protein [Chloroflexia bacterium]
MAMAVLKERFVEPERAPAFELRVLPRGAASDSGPRYRLALYQYMPRTGASADAPLRHVVTLGGAALLVALDQVLEALRRTGQRATVLSPEHRDPIALGEEAGVRLGLLFLAIKPLSKVARMEAIATSIRSMPGEEAYYWFSKCARQKGRGSALRALRILLADE